VQEQYEKAKEILSCNMNKLHELAKYLYERETITGDEFMEILNTPAEEKKQETAEDSSADVAAAGAETEQ
jgi:cell division protease FtsH